MNMDTIKEIDVKSVMTKSSLPVGGYSVNPYVGCPHGYGFRCKKLEADNESS